MGIFDAIEKDRVEAAADRLQIKQEVVETGLLVDAIAESLADLHIKVGVLSANEAGQPAMERPDIKPSAPAEPEPPADTKPQLLSPSAPITSDRHVFKWSQPNGYSSFNLEVGTAKGGHDLFFQVNPIKGGSYELSRLSAVAGSEVWARLWYKKDGGAEEHTDYKLTLDIEGAPSVTIPSDPKGRAMLVFPDKPKTDQPDALPIVIHENGTAELSRATQVTLSHEPERQGAPVVENVPDLVRELKKRLPLIRVKGESMKAMSVSLSGEKFNGAEGVTVIEQEHDGAICPNFYLQDSSAVVLRNFQNQNRTWKFRVSGKCNSNGVSGIRFSEKTTKSPIGFSPPDQNRGSLDDCFAQDIFAVYDESVGYDEVMVVIGPGEIGWGNYRVAHARNLRIYNVSGLNRGEPIQPIANFSASDRRVKARTNLEGCVFAGGLGVATFSVGKNGGNNCPENGYSDGKCHSDNPDDPNIVIGGMGIGFGPSSSDVGSGTIEHGAKGYTRSSNHLFVAMPTAAGSSAYFDMDGVEISRVHVCGGGDYAEWFDRGFHHVHDKPEFAYFNYVDVPGSKKANMHDNTGYLHSNIGYGGGRALKESEVRKVMLSLPREFREADSRMVAPVKIYVPKNTKELVW